MQRLKLASMSPEEKKALIAQKLAEKRAKEVAARKAEMLALKEQFVDAKKKGDVETVKKIMAQLKALDAASKAAVQAK